MSPRSCLAGLLVALGAFALAGAPVAALAAPLPQSGGSGTVTIRLADVPTDQADDPRSQLYFVDHAEPGATLQRTVEVRNGTGSATTVSLYPGAADVSGDQFVFGEGREGNELTAWTSVTPPTLDLEPGEAAQAEVLVEVPDGASGGERYGVVWAELPAAQSGEVRAVNRVGVRMYLSIGGDEAPTSAFTVDSIEATRRADGTPAAVVAVSNTGELALDLGAELSLADGPGGASAGPFEADGTTTLAPGATASLEIAAPSDLPAGPWQATAVVASGQLEQSAEARITFPETPDASNGPVAATARAAPSPEPASNGTPAAGVAAGAVAGASVLGGTGMIVRARLLRSRGL